MSFLWYKWSKYGQLIIHKDNLQILLVLCVKYYNCDCKTCNIITLHILARYMFRSCTAAWKWKQIFGKLNPPISVQSLRLEDDKCFVWHVVIILYLLKAFFYGSNSYSRKKQTSFFWKLTPDDDDARILFFVNKAEFTTQDRRNRSLKEWFDCVEWLWLEVAYLCSITRIKKRTPW